MDGWTVSETRPGYREKTIQRGAATITILRPILDAKETAKRERHVQDVLGNTLRDYLIRKEGALNNA